jgi:hypothetical protein
VRRHRRFRVRSDPVRGLSDNQNRFWWAVWPLPDHFAEEGWGVEALISAPVIFAVEFVSRPGRRWRSRPPIMNKMAAKPLNQTQQRTTRYRYLSRSPEPGLTSPLS